METIAQGSGKSITNDCREVTAFKKFRFKHVFRPHENEKPAFSKSSSLKSVFEEASFSRRISVDGRPNRRNKASFGRELSLNCWLCYWTYCMND